MVKDSEKEQSADEGGYHSDGELPRIEKNPRDQIGQHQKHGSAKQRGGKQLFMVWPGEHTGHVRRDQSHEANGSADGHAHADQRGDRNQESQADPLYVDADVPGILFADGKRVQFPGVEENQSPEDQQRGAQQGGILIAASGKGAHGPEGDGFHFFTGKGGNQ